MKISIAAILSIFSVMLYAQITPEEALKQMGRGINMGNTLEAPSEGAWAPKAHEYYFQDYKAAGYKTVRIPVRWYPYTSEMKPFKISDEWLNRVETVVDWALKHDFFVILNAHHSEPIKEDYEGQKERWDSIWRQVSFRFKDKSENLFFELMNEPNGWTVDQVNDYNSRILDIIRKNNPTRTVILAGNNWSSANDLIQPELNIPDDPFLMGTFHSYDPWEFGGQGKITWGSQSDKNAIAAMFQNVRNWSLKKGIPVILGEFGSTYVNDNGGESDLNSRFRHYACFVENALKNHIAFTVWDDNGWFQVYQRESRTWKEWNDILLHYSPQSVTNFTAEMQLDYTAVLTWTNQAKQYDSITIERKQEGGKYVTIGKVLYDSNSYIDSDLLLDNKYYYRVITHQPDTASSFGYPQIIVTQPPIARGCLNDKPALISGIIEAEHFDMGDEGDAYHDTDLENKGGAYRLNTGVDIEECIKGGYHVAYAEPGEWLEYSIEIKKNTDYYITAMVASANGGGAFKMFFDRGKTRIWQVPSMGDWQQFTNVEMNRLRLPAGEQAMQIEMVEGNFNIDKFIFTEANSVNVDHVSANTFQIFPNPTTGNFSVQNANFPILNIEVLDMHGRKVFGQNMNGLAYTITNINPSLTPWILYRPNCCRCEDEHWQVSNNKLKYEYT